MATETGENAPAEGEEVRARLGRDLVNRLDAWIAAQPEPRPSRAEAIPRLLAETLGGTEAGSIAVEELNASNDE